MEEYNMRKNYTYIPKMPNSRNDFIDCLKAQDEVIIIKNDLIAELSSELNKNISNRKKKNALRTVGATTFLIFSLSNPVTWIFGAGALATSLLFKNEIKKYNIHKGCDVSNKDIIVLIHKHKVKTALDHIAYDNAHIASVDEDVYSKKIVNKKSHISF